MTRTYARRRAAMLVLTAVALLTLQQPAQASDPRAGAWSDRLFYSSPITQDLGSFGTDPGEPGVSSAISCTGSSGVAINTNLKQTAWYRVVGTGGTITVSTAGSPDPGGLNGTLDTVLAVYSETATTPSVCSDDTTLTGGDHTSRVAGFPTTANTPYDVQVGLFSGASCTSCVVHLLVTSDSAPANDLRANAAPITAPTSANNSFASDEPGEILACPNQGPSQDITRSYGKTVWYSFAAPGIGTATFRAGSPLDTVEAVYDASSATQLGCNDDDGTGVTASRLDVSVRAGRTYLLQVGGLNGGFGAFVVSVDFAAEHDVDGDGFIGSAFGGPDCNDGVAAIHPGATDVPHNGVDENCDGTDAPYPAPTAEVHGSWSLLRSGLTRFDTFFVSGVEVPSTVTLNCKGHRQGPAACPFKNRSLDVTRATKKKVSIVKFLDDRELAPGTTLDIRVTRAETIGLDYTLTTRAHRLPKHTTLCLEPGSTKPRKSCS